MEGADVEERSSSEGVQDTAKHVAEAHDAAGDENKFQKAIGAWRSTTPRRIQGSSELTMRQPLISPPSCRSSTTSHPTLSHTSETRSRKEKTSRRRRRTSGSWTMLAS
jgi:hypothetical protein